MGNLFLFTCIIKYIAMKKSMKIYRIIIRILGSLALVGYIQFLIEEGVPLLTSGVSFADISVYILFTVFLAAYILLWKQELLSGILMIIWYGLLLLCVFEVWDNAALVAALAIPIPIIGIVVIIFGILKKRAKAS